MIFGCGAEDGVYTPRNSDFNQNLGMINHQCWGSLFQTTCDPKLRLTRVSEVSIFLVGHFKYFKQLGCFRFGQNLLSIAKIMHRSYRSQIAI